jgi:hypothetical protein
MCESERESEPIINRLLGFRLFFLVEHAFSVFFFDLFRSFSVQIKNRHMKGEKPRPRRASALEGKEGRPCESRAPPEISSGALRHARR